MNKMQKIMLTALLIDIVAVTVIIFKFQEIEQLLLYINGAVMSLVLLIGLANLIVMISRKRERNTEAIFRTLFFIPSFVTICVFSFVPSSIKSIATPLTMAFSSMLLLLFFLVRFLILRIGKKQ